MMPNLARLLAIVAIVVFFTHSAADAGTGTIAARSRAASTSAGFFIESHLVKRRPIVRSGAARWTRYSAVSATGHCAVSACGVCAWARLHGGQSSYSTVGV